MYRQKTERVEFFLVHPGGPFWAKKDEGVWSIPKGEFLDEENRFEVAKREFLEEIGTEIRGDFIELSPIRQKSGKMIFAWAVKGDFDSETIRSNTFKLEWPPKSGKIQEFPEIDKSGWFHFEEAKQKINPAQIALLEELIMKITNTP